MKTDDLKARQCMAKYVENMSDASKRKEKHKCAIEKPKLEIARRLRGIFLENLDDEEFKRVLKNARRNLENSDASSNPFVDFNIKAQENLLHRWTSQDEICSCCGCRRIFEDTAWKALKTRTMKTTSQEGAQIYSCASSHENARCKGSRGERIGKKLAKLPAWQLTKVRKQK